MNRKKKNKKNYRKKIEAICLKCKAKFDIWLSNSNFEGEIEETIKRKLFQHCPDCRALEA